MHALGQGLANGTGGFRSFDMGLDHHRLDIYFQPVKTHPGEVKQEREGFHDFLLHKVIEQMFFLSCITFSSSKVSQNRENGSTPHLYVTTVTPSPSAQVFLREH